MRPHISLHADQQQIIRFSDSLVRGFSNVNPLLQLARNPVPVWIGRIYVEFFRNVPVLLQLLMWYLLFTEALPLAADAWAIGPDGVERRAKILSDGTPLAYRMVDPALYIFQVKFDL